jgi:hypothetical protein
VEEWTAERDAASRVLLEAEEPDDCPGKCSIAMSVVDRNLIYKWFRHPLIPDAEQYLGRTAESFLPPDQAAELNARRRRVLDTGIGSRHEICLVCMRRSAEIGRNLFLRRFTYEKRRIPITRDLINSVSTNAA